MLQLLYKLKVCNVPMNFKKFEAARSLRFIDL